MFYKERDILPCAQGLLKMKATLILCVKNGDDRLQTCLDHIARLNGPDDLQIILVWEGAASPLCADNSNDITFKCMAAFAETSKFECLLLQNLTPGNSAARNSAIKKATGELVIFIDGDCYVEANFVKDWLIIFSMIDIGFASGRIVRFNQEYSMLGCNESRTEKFIRALAFVPRGLIQGSNMAFRRSCLERAGLFDEHFGGGTPFAGEEWELALRASFVGFGGGYFPTPGVTHDHRRLGHIARERLLYYDYGAGAVYAKHMFGRRRLVVTRKFLDEICWLKDRERVAKLSKGWVDYHLARVKLVYERVFGEAGRF